MKKKKLAQQSTPDFKNKPFQALKTLKPAAASAPAREHSKREEPKEVEDDSELFLRAVADAQKLRKDKTLPSQRALQQQTRKTDFTSTTQDQQLFLQAMRQVGTTLIDFQQNTNEKTEDRQHRSSSSRMRQLKRGTIRISQELDLHGFLRDEAISRLEQFIANAFSRGMDAVLVITGKGINSPEGPVLRGAAEAWLRGRGKRMVAEFSPAPRDKGGSGAFVVFIKKKT